jgi:hypothetical protein
MVMKFISYFLFCLIFPVTGYCNTTLDQKINVCQQLTVKTESSPNIADVIDNEIFKDLDTSVLFKKYSTLFDKKKTTIKDENIHDRSEVIINVFDETNFFGVFVASQKHQKLNLICIDTDSHKEKLTENIFTGRSIEYFKKKYSLTSTFTQLIISSYDGGFVFELFFKDGAVSRIRYINAGYEG